MPCTRLGRVSLDKHITSQASCKFANPQVQHCSHSYWKLVLRNPQVADLADRVIGIHRLSRINLARVSKKGGRVSQHLRSMSQNEVLAEEASPSCTVLAASSGNGAGNAMQGSVGRASEFEGEEAVEADPSTSGQSPRPGQGQAPLFRFGVITGRS